MLQLVHQHHRRLRRRFPLEACDQEPRGSNPQAAQRYAFLIVEGDCAAGECCRVRVKQRADISADIDPQLFRRLANDTQRFGQLRCGIVAERLPCVSGRLYQRSRSVGLFIGQAIEDGAAPPAEIGFSQGADPRW